MENDLELPPEERCILIRRVIRERAIFSPNPALFQRVAHAKTMTCDELLTLPEGFIVGITEIYARAKGSSQDDAGIYKRLQEFQPLEGNRSELTYPFDLPRYVRSRLSQFDDRWTDIEIDRALDCAIVALGY